MTGHWSLGVLLSLTLSVGAHGAEVQLVTGDDYAPLTGKSLAGAGVLSEVVQAAFAQSGMPSSLAWQPWKRGYLMTRRGEYDATFPYIFVPSSASVIFSTRRPFMYPSNTCSAGRTMRSSWSSSPTAVG